MESLYVVGSGAVGAGFAIALSKAGWNTCGITDPSADARHRVQQWIGIDTVFAELHPTIANATIVLVCVPDTHIADVGSQLAAQGALKPGTVVAHTSGCMRSDALGPLAGVETGSIHPLVACPTPERAGQALWSAPFAVEGTPPAVVRLTAMGQALNGRILPLQTEHKSRYHAAAVMASNLVVALLDVASTEARRAGLQNDVGLLAELAIGALQQVKSLGTQDGLTGPIVRGDHTTLQKHLDCLEGTTRDLYIALSRQAVTIAQKKGLSNDDTKRLLQLFAPAVQD